MAISLEQSYEITTKNTFISKKHPERKWRHPARQTRNKNTPAQNINCDLPTGNCQFFTIFDPNILYDEKSSQFVGFGFGFKRLR